MKLIYNDIVALKSKSGIGFAWNDENGMGVTPDGQAEWDSLYPVCEHLTRRLMTFDHY